MKVYMTLVNGNEQIVVEVEVKQQVAQRGVPLATPMNTAALLKEIEDAIALREPLAQEVHPKRIISIHGCVTGRMSSKEVA